MVEKRLLSFKMEKSVFRFLSPKKVNLTSVKANRPILFESSQNLYFSPEYLYENMFRIFQNQPPFRPKVSVF